MNRAHHTMKLFSIVAGLLLASSVAAQGVVINELVTDGTDWCEIVNFSGAPVNIGGWSVIMTADGSATSTLTFPAGTMIAPNEVVAITESTGTALPPGVQRFVPSNINWNTNVGGACGLVNSVGAGMDLVVFGNATTLPAQSPPSPFTGSLPSSGVNTSHFFRRITTTDTDSAADWTMTDGPSTPGALNQGQAATGSPTAAFTADRTIVPGQGWVRFNDLSSGNPATWAWDVGADGTIESTSPSPTFLFSTIGMHTVRLTVANSFGMNVNTAVNFIQVVAPTPVTAPYTQNFSGVTLGTEWEIRAESAIGRTRLIVPGAPTSPLSGGAALALDSLGGLVTNQVVLHVDLIATGGGTLRYYARETSDENHPEDGLFLSDGITTIQVANHTTLTANWTEFVIDVAALALQNGLTSLNDLQLIFSQRDDNPMNTDGVLIDDVRLIPPPMPDTGQANTVLAQLNISNELNLNGSAAFIGQAGPFFTTTSDVQITVRGQPNQPYLLLLGPLNRDNAVFPFGSLDIGLMGGSMNFSDVQVLLNGAGGSSVFDSLARLDGSGRSDVSFGLPGFPPGLILGTFQAVVYNSTPSVIGLSAAIQVTVAP